MSTNPEHTNGSAKIDKDGSIESDGASISSKEEDEKVNHKPNSCFIRFEYENRLQRDFPFSNDD